VPLPKSHCSHHKKNSIGKRSYPCDFGDPLQLKEWDGIPALLAAYTDDGLMPKIAAQIIFGGMGAQGVLSVDLSDSDPCRARRNDRHPRPVLPIPCRKLPVWKARH